MKKVTKIQKVRSKFFVDDNGNIDIGWHGTYNRGLTDSEIDDYLRARANKYDIRKINRQFAEIAGVNTCALEICEFCGKEIHLMYRHDVKRFADKLFDGTPTLWD